MTITNQSEFRVSSRIVKSTVEQIQKTKSVLAVVEEVVERVDQIPRMVNPDDENGKI